MRKSTFVFTLVSSFVLSACASESALDLAPRDVTAGFWRARITYAVPSQALPTVDTSAPRETRRHVPLSPDRINLASGQR